MLTYKKNCNSEVSKTTLWFNGLLEGLTELRKAVLLTVMVSYRERVQIKVSQGKRHRGPCPGDSGCKLAVVSASGAV